MNATATRMATTMIAVVVAAATAPLGCGGGQSFDTPAVGPDRGVYFGITKNPGSATALYAVDKPIATKRVVLATSA